MPDRPSRASVRASAAFLAKFIPPRQIPRALFARYNTPRTERTDVAEAFSGEETYICAYTSPIFTFPFFAGISYNENVEILIVARVANADRRLPETFSSANRLSSTDKSPA